MPSETKERVPPRTQTAANPLPPRIEIVVGIERVVLALRYVGFVSLVAFYLWGSRPDAVPNLLVITLGAVVQNAFVHWVLYTKQYEWFLSPLNFFIHLGKVCLLVGVTGGEDSPAALLYLGLIIGYCLYAPRFRGAFRPTLAACIAYALTLLIFWAIDGIGVDQTPIAVNFTAIVACGWLVGRLGEMTRRIETDAHNRAAELASSEATLRAILDSTAQPIIVYEDNEFVSDVNNRACEYLGASRTQLIGRRFRSFLFDDGTLPNKLATLRTRGEYFGEALVITEEGEERSVHLVARSFARGDRRLFVALLLDITEQKNLQETQRQATLQVEQVNRELKRLHDIRTAFFTSISHRLRSPLSAILGHVGMLLNGELGPLTQEQKRSLQSAHRSANRVFEMLDEAFEVEGVKPRPQPPRPEREPVSPK